MSNKIRYSLLAILSLILVFGVFGSAAAQEITPQEETRNEQRPLRQRRGVRGQITAIQDDQITLELRERSITVNISDETRFHIISQEEASLDDFSVGDIVLARGRREEGGDLLATLIVLQPDGDRVLGRVAAVYDDGLLLNGRPDADGNPRQITVNASPDTIVAMIGQETTWGGDPAGRDLLQEGMFVAAFGAASADGLTLDAHTLTSTRPPAQRRAAVGQIEAIQDDGFTLTALNGDTLTIIVTDDTVFHIGRDNEASWEDFNTGDKVIVAGERSEDGTTIIAAHVAKRR